MDKLQLVLSRGLRFLYRRLHFSSQAKDRSTTQRWGSTAKVCRSLQITASGHLYRGAQRLPGSLCERLGGVTAIDQNTLAARKMGQALLSSLQGTLAVSDIGRYDGYCCMRQGLSSSHNMALDARDLFACVLGSVDVSFFIGRRYTTKLTSVISTMPNPDQMA